MNKNEQIWREIKFQAFYNDKQHIYGCLLYELLETFCKYFPSNITKDEAGFIAEYDSITSFGISKHFKFNDLFYVSSFIKGIYMIVTDMFPQEINEKQKIYQRFCQKIDPNFEPFPPLPNISMERYKKLWESKKTSNDLLTFLENEIKYGEILIALLGALDFCKTNNLPPLLFKKGELETIPINELLSRSKKELEQYI